MRETAILWTVLGGLVAYTAVMVWAGWHIGKRNGIQAMVDHFAARPQELYAWAERIRADELRAGEDRSQ